MLSPEVAQQIAHMEQISLPSLRILKISEVPLVISLPLLAKIHAPHVNDFSWGCEVEPLTGRLSLLRSGSPHRFPGHVMTSMVSGDVEVNLGLSGDEFCKFDIIASGEDNEGTIRRVESRLQPDALDLQEVFDLFMIGSVVATLFLNMFPYGDTILSFRRYSTVCQCFAS
ncbi:hypothetical protein FRB94_012858 [Tulasnella sp. JGI-2019a]|nr:hypothetical protein FRB94_012858 [Tulasnella sp. JGI-2019a]